MQTVTSNPRRDGSPTRLYGACRALLAGVLLFALIPALASGQTITAVASGNWNSTATWSPATVPTAANDVIVAGGFTVTVNVATAAGASLQIGVSPGTTGTLAFNAGSILTVSGAGVTIANGTLNMTSGGTLKIAGAFTIGAGGTFTAGSGTIEYNGGSQNIAATTYRHLVLRNGFPASPKTLLGSIIVTGDLASDNAMLAAGANNITLAGNWNSISDPNNLDAGTGTVTLNGTSHQNINGASSFYNLTVNNSAGVSLGGVVGQLLTLQNGNLTTGRLAIFGAGSGVTRVSGHVIGTLVKYFGLGGSVAQIFEVGTASRYTPVTLTLHNVTDDSQIEVEAVAGDHSAIGSSTLNAGKSVNVNWRINNLEAVFTDYAATFNFNAADLDAGVNTNNLAAGKFLDPNWTYPTVSNRTATSLTLTDTQLQEEEDLFFQLAEPSTGTTFAGMTNTSLGSASMSLDLNNHLLISNIGASGLDGVSFNLGQAQFGELDFGSTLAFSPGAFVQASAIGSLNNVPGQTIGSIRYTGVSGGNTNVEFDLSAVSATGPCVIVYNGATQVFLGTVPGNNVEVAGSQGPCVIPFQPVPGLGGAINAQATVLLGGKFAIAIPGGPTVTGDRIVFLAENISASVEYVSDISVIGANLNSFTLEAEAIGLFDTNLHTAAGSAFITSTQQPASLLTVSNLGASLLDGVDINLEEAGATGPCYLVGLTGVPLSGVNEQVHFEAISPAMPAAFGAVDLLATGSGFDVNVDYSAIGASLVEVMVFNAGVPVGSAIVPAGTVGTITGAANLIRTFVEARGTVGPCMIVGFANPVSFAFASTVLAKQSEVGLAQDESSNLAKSRSASPTSPLLGDEIHFHAVNPTSLPSGVSSVTLLMANVPEFTINNEASEAPSPRVFVSNGAITIDRSKHSASQGDLHSNATITFKKGDPTTFTGNLSAVGKITINKDNTIVGNAISGSTISVASGASITGTTTPNANVASLPITATSFSAGGANITVPKNGSRTLSPGSYGNVSVGKSAKLNLKSGEYRFVKLETQNKAFLNFDVSNGGVQVKVTKNLKFDDEVRVVITPGGEVNSNSVDFITLQSSKVWLDKECYVLGTLIAPKAEVETEKDVRFRGAIMAKKITIDRDVIFLHHTSPGVLPLPKPAANEEEVADASRITDYVLEQNYPNPFNPSTTIRFALPEAGEVSLKIYNINGQLVRELVNAQYESGRHSVVWDGTDAHSNRVASGVYLYVLKAGDFVAKKKLVLMK